MKKWPNKRMHSKELEGKGVKSIVDSLGFIRS